MDLLNANSFFGSDEFVFPAFSVEIESSELPRNRCEGVAAIQQTTQKGPTETIKTEKASPYRLLIESSAANLVLFHRN